MKNFFKPSFSKHSPSNNCDCGALLSKRGKIELHFHQGSLKYCSTERKSNGIHITKYNVHKKKAKITIFLKKEL